MDQNRSSVLSRCRASDMYVYRVMYGFEGIEGKLHADVLSCDEDAAIQAVRSRLGGIRLVWYEVRKELLVNHVRRVKSNIRREVVAVECAGLPINGRPEEVWYVTIWSELPVDLRNDRVWGRRKYANLS